MSLIPVRHFNKQDIIKEIDWTTINGCYPKGKIFDQSKKDFPDPNYCSGCTAANVFQISTGKIESGLGIYNETKKYEEKILKKSNKFSYGSSFVGVFSALTRRNNLKNSELIYLSNLDEVMTWLILHGPIAFGGNWTQGMVNPRGFWKRRWMKNKGAKMVKHAGTIIGTNNKGFIIIENSWGWKWGNKGLACMKWEEFKSFLSDSYTKCFGFNFDY